MQGEVRKVAEHSATYAVAVLAGGLGRVFLLPIVTRFLSADEYGVVALVLAFVSLAGILMDLGLATSLIKFYSETEDPRSRRRIISTVFLCSVVSSVGVTLLFTPLAHVFSSLLFKRSDYHHFIYLGLGLALSYTIFKIALSYYQALPAPKKYAAVSVVKGVLGVGGAAFFVIYLGWGPAGFLAGNIVPPAVLAIVITPAILKSVGLAFDGGAMRRSLRFGVPLVPSTFAMWGLTYCDIYLLGRLASLEEVGWYQLAQEICMGMGFVVAAVQLAWPRFIFSHSRDPGAPRAFARAAEYYVVVLAFVGLCLSVFGREVILLIGSETYTYVEAAPVIPILCLSMVFFALYGVFASGVQIEGRTEFMAITTACGLGLNVILNLWMIPRWGMVGAATASVISNIGMCAAVLRMSARFYVIPFSVVRLVSVLGAAVILFGVSRIAGSLEGFYWVLLAKAAVVLALPAVVIFGLFSKEELARARGMVRDLYHREG